MTTLSKGALAVCAFALTVGLAFGGYDEGHDEGHGEGHAKGMPFCPVMGDETVNFAVSTATDEGPVFFCCKDCIEKYTKKPEKYAEKVAAQRKVLADRPKVQLTCPVSKNPVDPKVTVDTDNGKVGFCCTDCIEKYQKEPAKYASALANSYTYQTVCPVMGETINPTVHVTAEGGAEVYFCCKGCIKKFKTDQAKYAPKLEEQGVLLAADHDDD